MSLLKKLLLPSIATAAALTGGCDDTTTPLPESGKARVTAVVRAVTCQQDADGVSPRIHFVWDSPVSDVIGCATIDIKNFWGVWREYLPTCTHLQESRDYKMPIMFWYEGTNHDGCFAATAVEPPTDEMRKQYR